MTTPELSLVNVFVVESEGAQHHLVCFLDTVLAGVKGIPSNCIIGEYHPTPSGEFDQESFLLNPAFIEALAQYMNEEVATAPQIASEAAEKPSEWLYLLDPRCHQVDPEVAPLPGELLGCFAVDAEGQIVPKSFQYNENHVWFSPTSGTSGVLSDRSFYDWLHPLKDRGIPVT